MVWIQMLTLVVLKAMLNFCDKTITKIDSNEGYHYLSTLKSKLESDKKTLKEYIDFVKDANSSFKDFICNLWGKNIRFR